MNGLREIDLKILARQIFSAALGEVDTGEAVRRAVRLEQDKKLIVAGDHFELPDEESPVCSVALGKAAYPMALALDQILSGRLAGGVISGFLPGNSQSQNLSDLSKKWRVFAGGHPLPNEDSLAAAASAFELLRAADRHEAIVIFLISGGGSAMIEAAGDEAVSLADLREANRVLVSCGAPIDEINLVRRSFSKIKGGGLASLAPQARQISLIISDTEPGDERSVASGPTFAGQLPGTNLVMEIIDRYQIAGKLPKSILDSIRNRRFENPPVDRQNLQHHYVLGDNQTAVRAAAEYARSLGLDVEIAADISQQNVDAGCRETVDRIDGMQDAGRAGGIKCLISGGEFSCPVHGRGKGGRNSETVLRTALLLDEKDAGSRGEIAFLSAGTDGIDGNSPAAGAVCDRQTIEDAKKLNLDALTFLEESDSYGFFSRLGDDVMTGPTGTNVRDLRIMLARR